MDLFNTEEVTSFTSATIIHEEVEKNRDNYAWYHEMIEYENGYILTKLYHGNENPEWILYDKNENKVDNSFAFSMEFLTIYSNIEGEQKSKTFNFKNYFIEYNLK